MTYILAARQVVASLPGSTATPSIPRPPDEDRVIYLLGVNGDKILLTAPRDGLSVQNSPAPSGLWLPEYQDSIYPTPGVDGARLGDVVALPRIVGFTVQFNVETLAQIRALKDRLVRALNPKRGTAGFLVIEADNTARVITGRYVGGELFEVVREQGAWRIDLLAADDPYWQDAPGSEIPDQTWAAPEPVDFYPYLPTNLTEDSAIGEPVRIDNNGHEDIFPTWLIHGPATSALLTGAGDTDLLLWEGDLPAGKWLVIVTQPGMQQVVDSDGNSRFHELAQDPEPSFFPLEPGSNLISTVIGGIGEGTRVTLMDLTRRWLIQG